MTDEELTAIRERLQQSHALALEAVYTANTQTNPFHQWVSQVAGDEAALLAEVERWREIGRALAALTVMDDCSRGNDFPQRLIYLYDKKNALDVITLRDQASALLGDDA